MHEMQTIITIAAVIARDGVGRSVFKSAGRNESQSSCSCLGFDMSRNVSDVRAAAIDMQADENGCHRRSVTIAWLSAVTG